MEGLLAYPYQRVATPAYPLAANIRQIRYRYHCDSGFLCKFNTFASLLGAGQYKKIASSNYTNPSVFLVATISRSQSPETMFVNISRVESTPLNTILLSYSRSSNGVLYIKAKYLIKDSEKNAKMYYKMENNVYYIYATVYTGYVFCNAFVILSNENKDFTPTLVESLPEGTTEITIDS